MNTFLLVILLNSVTAQSGMVEVNGQAVRYFINSDSSLSTTKAWTRTSDGVDRYKSNSAYPFATHLYNGSNAVTGNIIPTQAAIIQHLHNMGIKGSGVKIGIIDVDFSEYTGLRFEGGIGSYLNETPSTMITEHGTSMSSIIGEKPNGNGLVKPNGIVGIAYDAQLYACPITNSIDEVQWCIDNGMDIINMAYATGYSLALKNKIQEAVQKGIYVCAATGNGSIVLASAPITFPASVTGVFSITARSGGHVFADDSTKTYSNILPSTITGVSKGLDFAIPGWAVGRDNAFGRNWTAHVGTSESVSIFTGYMALILNYFKTYYGFKPKPFQMLNWLSNHTINPTWGGKYFQDMNFINIGQENSPAPNYIPLPPIN